MRFPLSTGQTARLLGTSEPHVAETVRRGKVHPAPPVLAGRRLWSPAHVIQAARVLDRLTPRIKAELEAALWGKRADEADHGMEHPDSAPDGGAER